ncbi:hypothetical protein LLG95_15945, partial [bacterium]|nr:hypothetical protein [bacterium]
DSDPNQLRALKAREKSVSFALSALRFSSTHNLGLRCAPPQAKFSCAFSAKIRIRVIDKSSPAMRQSRLFQVWRFDDWFDYDYDYDYEHEHERTTIGKRSSTSTRRRA